PGSSLPSAGAAGAAGAERADPLRPHRPSIVGDHHVESHDGSSLRAYSPRLVPLDLMRTSPVAMSSDMVRDRLPPTSCAWISTPFFRKSLCSMRRLCLPIRKESASSSGQALAPPATLTTMRSLTAPAR